MNEKGQQVIRNYSYCQWFRNENESPSEKQNAVRKHLFDIIDLYTIGHEAITIL